MQFSLSLLEVETNLKELIEESHDPQQKQRNVDDIINMVTADNLCSCRDPINMAFQVHNEWEIAVINSAKANLSFSVDSESSCHSYVIMFFKKFGKDYIRHLFIIPEFHVNPSSVPERLYRRRKIIDPSLSRSSSSWSTESFIVTPSWIVSRHVWNSLRALSIYQT